MEKLYIIKIGGNVINRPDKLDQFIDDLAKVKGKKILVHGGGRLVDELALKLGIQQQMIDGRRVTDAETLKLTAMVYAGLLNKSIVALLQAKGTNALGLSGADANCIPAVKRTGALHDYGFAGDVVQGKINTVFISLLLGQDILPVFCSITHDTRGQLLNTNADTLAAELAKAFAGTYLVQLHYYFEKKGVMADPDKGDSLIPAITTEKYHILLRDKVISNGMIPKLSNAFDAVKSGVSTVVIAHSDELLNTIDLKEHAGTYLSA